MTTLPANRPQFVGPFESKTSARGGRLAMHGPEELRVRQAAGRPAQAGLHESFCGSLVMLAMLVTHRSAAEASRPAHHKPAVAILAPPQRMNFSFAVE